MKFAFALAFTGLIAMTVPATAAVVLDQDNLMTVTPGFGQYSGLIGNSFDYRQAQIVTAGVTGTLARVDLQIARAPSATGALILELVSLPLPNATGPGFSILASSMTTAFDGQIVSVDVSSANFAVTAGSSFALLLRSDVISTPNRYRWLFGEQDIDGNNVYTRDYAAGVNNLYNVYAPGTWGESGLDRGFATYVNTVPEPASWAFMIAGFGLVGGALRSRRGLATA